MSQLPGVNQVMPPLDEAVKLTLLGRPGSSTRSSSTTAMFVNLPLPGKNQPQPTMDAFEISSIPTSDDPVLQSSIKVSTAASPMQSIDMQSMDAPPADIITSQLVPTSAITSITRTSDATPLVPTSSFVGFITLAKTEEEKVPKLPPLSDTPVPQTVTSTRSGASLASSTPNKTSLVPGGTTTSPVLSTTVESQQRQGTLTPLTRTLLTLFGVLGAATMLIALGVFLVFYINKKKGRPRGRKTQQDVNRFDTLGVKNEYPSTQQREPHISAIINPFLTESEKAIVARATSPNGELNHEISNDSSRFADAINLFIAKSRRLTYKISP